jgi:DNA repair protein RadA/Sms
MPSSTKRRASGSLHSCSDCGFSSLQWFGKCPDCGSWSTATALEGSATSTGGVQSLAGAAPSAERSSTGLTEVDRVLGGGIVPGSVLLLAGEPGIGKSTLVLQLMQAVQDGGRKALLVTGEESLDQVSMRARRLGLDADRLRAAPVTRVAGILAACNAENPDLLLVDSIQTLEDDTVEQGAGSATQVRASAAALVKHAKESGTAVVLVGHVTKDGNVAGPKTLEHLVDTVLALEGERSGSMRLLRAAKNRFGSCEETGVFTMTGSGLEGVADPSAMFLSDRAEGVPGSIIFPSLEGSRPVLLEIQALVTGTNLPQPRRVPIGLDARRLALVLAVLAERAGVRAGSSDVFAAAAGGLSVREPAADLAVALAIASASAHVALPQRVAAFGEVGLGGELRKVPGAGRRLIEAARLGLETVIVPRGTTGAPRGLRVVECVDVRSAKDALGLEAPRER